MTAPDPLAIWKHGVLAGIRGDDPRSCPFDQMTKEWDEWQRGLTFGVGLGPEPPITVPIVRLSFTANGLLRQEPIDGTDFYYGVDPAKGTP